MFTLEFVWLFFLGVYVYVCVKFVLEIVRVCGNDDTCVLQQNWDCLLNIVVLDYNDKLY